MGTGPVPAGSQIPAKIRSGLRRGSAGGRDDSMQPWSEVALAAPVDAGSWRAAVRVGFVDLVAREVAAARETVPETLQLDAERLHDCQERCGAVVSP